MPSVQPPLPSPAYPFASFLPRRRHHRISGRPTPSASSKPSTTLLPVGRCSWAGPRDFAAPSDGSSAVRS
eukprot:2746284-Prymnesium_polylepis.1